MTLSPSLQYSRTRPSAVGAYRPTPVPQTFYVRRGKRLLDLIVAVALALVLFPLLVLGVAVVALSLGRPIFFTQDRVGRNGELFRIWKLRTLRHQRSSAADVLSRCTRQTSWLRRASIDEIPQLWNIIRGDMTLVGPRPEVATIAQFEDMIDHPRHLVRPGLTGAWQVSDARRFGISAGAAIDSDYVSSLSLGRDIRILVQTPRAVLASRTN